MLFVIFIHIKIGILVVVRSKNASLTQERGQNEDAREDGPDKIGRAIIWASPLWAWKIVFSPAH